MVKIIGISAFYHDSAVALLVDGELVAAAQEERFTRIKHDASFPANAIAYCLQHAGLKLEEIDYLVFYDKPLLKFERILETFLHHVPAGIGLFTTAMPIWLKQKLLFKQTVRHELASVFGVGRDQQPEMLFDEHHASHAASAFFGSPYARAAVLCIDGVGEWATTSTWLGEDRDLQPLWQIDYPHSLGLLYSAFTYHAGFRVNSGEYKLMGLAPYGKPIYTDLIYENLIKVQDNGAFTLNLDYFGYLSGLRMTNTRFDDLFGSPPREPEREIEAIHLDMAASIQKVTEDVVLKLAYSLHSDTGESRLCLAGGVALNCVANGRLLREGPFDEIWVAPASGDAGGACGAAWNAWHGFLRKPRTPIRPDGMSSALLGPSFLKGEILEYLEATGAVYHVAEDSGHLSQAAQLLAEGKVVGWFQGRMEYGPRALGARSILANPQDQAMQSRLNLKIKFRESFRPFAPVIKREALSDWFDMSADSPYMLQVAPVSKHRRRTGAETDGGLWHEALKRNRSEIPAVTHVDFSARIQTVEKTAPTRMWDLLDEFESITGCPILVNTSFNVRGEPIVCTPEDAYRCFMATDMDVLVIENILLHKAEQPNRKDYAEAYETLELD